MQDLVVNERLTIPSRELRWRFSRSSGPGGQGVNTTDSRVELLLDLANCSCLGPFRRARLLEHFQTRLVEGCLCLLYTSPSPRDATLSRMPSSA